MALPATKVAENLTELSQTGGLVITAKPLHRRRMEALRRDVGFRKIWRREGLNPLLLRERPGLVSVAMSLIFNVAKRLDEITNVYADSALAQVAGS